MAVLDSELKLMKSAAVNDTASNGGRISANEVVSGVANNVWPNITPAQRTAGLTRYRKLFVKIANAASTAWEQTKVFLSQITPGTGSRVVFFAATQRDTQNDITGSERKFGAGQLNANVSAGATTLVVDVEAGADGIFVAADPVYVGDGTNEEFVTIAAGGVSLSVDQYTLTLEAPGTVNAYTAATPTVVASVYEPGTIAASADNYAVSSASGTYDDAGNPVTLNGIGTIEQTWTVTFSDATNFSVVGDVIGSVGAGSTAADFEPVNGDFSEIYFSLKAAGWGGTWANGDTLVFQTHPAAAPIWERLTIDAGAASVAADATKLELRGASA